ncbi:MAG: hypothetical protein Kow0031_20120 [Anaerolineae bacterium]
MNHDNPVLMQIDGEWHIVEHSRRSTTSLCGKKITHRGAHARLSLVGAERVCSRCRRLWQGEQAAQQ